MRAGSLFDLPPLAGIVLLLRERITGGGETVSLLDSAIGALAISAAGAAVAFGAIVDATGGSSVAIATTWRIRSATWRSSRSWSAAWPRPAGGSAAAGRRRRSASCSSGSPASLYRLPGSDRQLQRPASSNAGWVVSSAVVRLQSANRGPRPRARSGLGAHSSFPPPSASLGLSVLVYDHFRSVHLLALALATACVASSDRAHVPVSSSRTCGCSARAGSTRPPTPSRVSATGASCSPTWWRWRSARRRSGRSTWTASRSTTTRTAIRRETRFSRARRPHEKAPGEESSHTGLAATSSASSPPDAHRAKEHGLTASAALSERGGGSEITSSFGTATMPADAPGRHRGDADRGPADVSSRSMGERARRPVRARTFFFRAIAERSPGLIAPPHRCRGSRRRRRAAARAAWSTRSSRCAMPPSWTTSARSRSLTRSCRSRTPLSDEEWSFVHKHTLIGSRIISARARAHTRCQARPLEPRALGRRRLPRPARRRRDPYRLPHRRRLRRPGGDGDRPPVPERPSTCPPLSKSSALRRQPVRSRRRRGPNRRS